MVGSALTRLRTSAAAEIVLWWAVSRAVVAAAAVVAALSGWPRPFAGGGAVAIVAGWDGGWYRLVVERGYHFLPFVQSDAAFFPLFPLLLLPARWLGLPLDVYGIVIANAMFLLALLLLHRLATRFVAAQTATRAAVYAAVSPFSFAFSMPYAESAVLAATAAAGLAAAAALWPAAAAASAAAALGRPLGALAAIVVAVPALCTSVSGRAGARLAAALGAPLALAVFALYSWRWTGDPLAAVRAQSEWGRSTGGPAAAARELWAAPRASAEIFHPRHLVWLLRDLAFLVSYASLLVAAARLTATPRHWIAFGALVLLVPLASGSVVSAARHGLLALPIYWGLAALVRTRRLDCALRVSGCALLAVNVVLLPAHHP